MGHRSIHAVRDRNARKAMRQLRAERQAAATPVETPPDVVALSEDEASDYASLRGRNNTAEEIARKRRQRVTLRWFSWEKPGEHEYRRPREQC